MATHGSTIGAHRLGRALTLAGAAIVGLGACTGGSQAALGQGDRTIPQPTIPERLAVAPESDRDDTAVPTFSDPTNITNPLFPFRNNGRS